MQFGFECICHLSSILSHQIFKQIITITPLVLRAFSILNKTNTFHLSSYKNFLKALIHPYGSFLDASQYVHILLLLAKTELDPIFQLSPTREEWRGRIPSLSLLAMVFHNPAQKMVGILFCKDTLVRHEHLGVHLEIRTSLQSYFLCSFSLDCVGAQACFLMSGLCISHC